MANTGKTLHQNTSENRAECGAEGMLTYEAEQVTCELCKRLGGMSDAQVAGLVEQLFYWLVDGPFTDKAAGLSTVAVIVCDTGSGWLKVGTRAAAMDCVKLHRAYADAKQARGL